MHLCPQPPCYSSRAETWARAEATSSRHDPIMCLDQWKSILTPFSSIDFFSSLQGIASYSKVSPSSSLFSFFLSLCLNFFLLSLSFSLYPFLSFSLISLYFSYLFSLFLSLSLTFFLTDLCSRNHLSPFSRTFFSAFRHTQPLFPTNPFFFHTSSLHFRCPNPFFFFTHIYTRVT